MTDKDERAAASQIVEPAPEFKERQRPINRGPPVAGLDVFNE